MGSCATDELRLVIDAKELWPRVRGQFTDPRLRGLYEDLEHSGLERVLTDKHTLCKLTGTDREAGIVRSLTVGAVDEARRTTGSTDSHVRTRQREAPLDEHLHGAGEDSTMAVAELLEALNLTGVEQTIAGCYAIGARNPRDIAYVLDKPVAYVNERLRTLLPYMRGMLADKVAPDLDESTRQLICRYAQGDLHTTRHWRERHNAQRLVANNPDCTHLYHAQCATDRRLRILLPTPVLAALTAHHSASEPAVHAAGGVRQHIADATATARRHATGLYHKAIDPTPLAGMRPGAAGAVLASCLTIGGGTATYCVNAAVNPLDAIRGKVAPAHHKPKRAAAHKKSTASRAINTAVITPPAATPPATPAPAKQPASAAPATSQPAATSPPPSTPGEEFSPESPSSSTTSSQQASSTRSRPAPKPAPAATNGPGEFGP